MTLETRFDSVLRRLRIRLSRLKRSSSVDVIEKSDDSADDSLRYSRPKKTLGSSLRSGRSAGKARYFSDVLGDYEVKYIQTIKPHSPPPPNHYSHWSDRLRELHRALRYAGSEGMNDDISSSLSNIPSTYRSHASSLHRSISHHDTARSSTHFPADQLSPPVQYRDVYGGYISPEFWSGGDTHPDDYEGVVAPPESGYSSNVRSSSGERTQAGNSPPLSEESMKSFHLPGLPNSGERQERKHYRDSYSRYPHILPSPKSLQTLSLGDFDGESPIDSYRSGRSTARSEKQRMLQARSLPRLFRRRSSASIESVEFLKSRIKETKYVTAVFESAAGGLAPVLGDIVKEFAHWLGTGSRLLAIACEVHWSVPENFRSRVVEIKIKDCLHKALRDNNTRVLNLYDECRKGLSASFVESKTEESCSRDASVDAFQGIYRRYYPDLLALQDESTVASHKSFWTLENMSSEATNPLKPSPAKFLYTPTPSQLKRKSIVAINMATLRLEGDEENYDVENRDTKEILI